MVSDRPDAGNDSDNFEVIDMGYGQRLGQPEASTKWITSFNTEFHASLYFGDYMAPFRELLPSLKDKTAHERGAAVLALIKGTFLFICFSSLSHLFIGSSFRLLVAVTGHTSTPDIRQLFGRAIEHITTHSP